MDAANPSTQKILNEGLAVDKSMQAYYACSTIDNKSALLCSVQSCILAHGELMLANLKTLNTSIETYRLQQTALAKLDSAKFTLPVTAVMCAVLNGDSSILKIANGLSSTIGSIDELANHVSVLSKLINRIIVTQNSEAQVNLLALTNLTYCMELSPKQLADRTVLEQLAAQLDVLEPVSKCVYIGGFNFKYLRRLGDLSSIAREATIGTITSDISNMRVVQVDIPDATFDSVVDAMDVLITKFEYTNLLLSNQSKLYAQSSALCTRQLNLTTQELLWQA